MATKLYIFLIKHWQRIDEKETMLSGNQKERKISKKKEKKGGK